MAIEEIPDLDLWRCRCCCIGACSEIREVTAFPFKVGIVRAEFSECQLEQGVIGSKENDQASIEFAATADNVLHHSYFARVQSFVRGVFDCHAMGGC
ncbi:MAG: hypothetical protein EAZ65_01265 [Verrucomicrobia bacterium]|nr:MAG: hypothetical protein EAZ84_06180 [Verrucomicrobiota bacterium]TAF27961.1 MAG: hypothetical protein EAZ71_01270 [Verrucomicrobiota bacterium]TAF42809.1 MAG: hypothetical protein EAZ65_01265 [Verrucomicrobiota bacterium]